MIDVVFFWTMLALVVLVLVLSWIILCYLPMCVDRVDYEELLKITKKQDTESITISPPDRQINTNFNKVGRPITNLQQRTNRVGTQINAQSVIQMESAVPKKSSTDAAQIEKNRYIMVISFGFKALLEFIILLITIVYPPTLWIVWSFFPTNSVSVLGTLFLGVKFLFTLLVIYAINKLAENWTLKEQFTQGKEPKISYQKEMRYLIAGTMGIEFSFYVYIFLRLLFMYIGSGIFLLDGWILLSVLAFVEVLFLVFPFTMM